MTDYSATPMRDLVRLYNETALSLGEKTVNKFADRKTAVRRVTEIAARTQGSTVPAAEEKPRKQRKQRGPHFKFKPREDNRPPQSGSMRGDAFTLLRREGGANIRELMDIFNREDKRDLSDPASEDYAIIRRRAYEAVRLMHYQHGYGLEPTGFEACRVYSRAEAKQIEQQ